jgi:hypothetical protein
MLLRDSDLLLRLRTLLQLHPPVALVIAADRGDCLNTLHQAARPSQHRLHLRELFTDGRRYYLHPHADGFRVTSDSRLFWGSQRRRTRVAASVIGAMSSGGEPQAPLTFIHLRSQTNTPYLLSGLIQPLLFSLIVLSTPTWSVSVRVVIAALLMALAFLGRRTDAALQANDLIYFVQKALADLPSGQVPSLEQPRPEVVTPFSAAFREQFERFYREHARPDD